MVCVPAERLTPLASAVQKVVLQYGHHRRHSVKCVVVPSSAFGAARDAPARHGMPARMSRVSPGAELLLHLAVALLADGDDLAVGKRDLIAAQRSNRLLVDQVRAAALQEAILREQLTRLR